MQLFTPGEEFGQAFEWLVLVCHNPAERSFERCQKEMAPILLATLKNQVQQLGLSRNVIVAPSGCLMGCKADGVTVALIKIGDTSQAKTLFFNNVGLEDMQQLLDVIQA